MQLFKCQFTTGSSKLEVIWEEQFFIEEMENQQGKTGILIMKINCNKDCKPVYFTWAI